MRTMIQSESTVVPPVTAERSPPASRMTGADSPVIADSLTDATPSMISPSPGMMPPPTPASTSTMSPLRSVPPGTVVTGASRRGAPSFLALTSRRVLRRLAACALPRPSAIASAKLANSTVNHSHTATQPMNPADASPSPTSAWTHSAVVRMLTMKTTNITGLRTCSRGFNFANAPAIAPLTMAGSKSARAVVG